MPVRVARRRFPYRSTYRPSPQTSAAFRPPGDLIPLVRPSVDLENVEETTMWLSAAKRHRHRIALLRHGPVTPAVPLTPRWPRRRERIPAGAPFIATVALALATAGCGADGDSPRGPTAQDAGPSAGPSAGPTATVVDLGSVIVAPPGFTPAQNDSVSGPISIDDLPKVFVDHPEDPVVIRDNGFRRGYIKSWVQTSAPTDGTGLPVRTSAYTVALEFSTAGGAGAVTGYFRQKNIEDHWELFAVPPELSNGYGATLVQGTEFKNYLHGVAWTAGTLLFDVMLVYPSPPDSTRQVTSLATAQNARVANLAPR
jgi:hypothetical protein